MIAYILSIIAIFVLIGIVTVLILSRPKNVKKTDPINIQMKLSKNNINLLTVNVDKLENKIIADEMLKIAKKFNNIQTHVCNHFKKRLRDIIKKLYQESRLMDNTKNPKCDDVKTEVNSSLQKDYMGIKGHITADEYTKNIYISLVESIKKISHEVINIICDNSANKVDKEKTLKLIEKSVNMICNIGFKGTDY